MTSSVRPFEKHVPRIGARAWIDPDARVIGNVELGDDVSLWPGVVLRGDVHAIRVGHRTNIQDHSVGHVTHDGPRTPGGSALVVGDDVTVGHAAVLHACTIGNRVLVGMGALVMDDVIVEDDVMIAAGSLVAPGKRLESGWLYRGRPAEAVRRLTDEEVEGLKYSAAHYVRLKDRYRAMESGVGGPGAPTRKPVSG
ncbi:MAG: gamma carbonic anhydrase family protein [Wenzhouxiangellaceae bacterium]|nr:gamma carbonic anhydrase family protein [Wenzhouxiangellaceae bacterium]